MPTQHQHQQKHQRQHDLNTNTTNHPLPVHNHYKSYTIPIQYLHITPNLIPFNPQQPQEVYAASSPVSAHLVLVPSVWGLHSCRRKWHLRLSPYQLLWYHGRESQA